MSKVERVKLAKGLEISRAITGLWQIADMEKDGKTLDPVATSKFMEPYVIAGFNAGFYKVQKWKVEEHRMPNDPLFFIESIPYAETRNYVKSVITDYWIYQTKLGISQYSLASMVQGGQPIYYSLDKEKIKALQTFAYSKDDGL